MQSSSSARCVRIALRGVRLIGTLTLLSTVATCTPATDGSAELAVALESMPGIAARLSIGNTFRPCSEQHPPNGTILRANCPAHRSARDNRIITIGREAAGKDEPHAVLTLAMIELFTHDERGKALDRSISSLRHLVNVVDRPAPVLADLAAALIVRAERTQAPRDLLEAYMIADRALQLEPENQPALFNAALALDRFGLVDETASGWRAYLAADARSGWAVDARRRLARLDSLPFPPAPPALDARLPAYTSYASADPQGARQLGMDRLLGEWGEAVEVGDALRARDRLNRAAVLGDALEQRPGGDASLADAVRAIRSVEREPIALRLLACAHREYAAGATLYEGADYSAAAPRLAKAVRAAGSSPVLYAWARMFWGTARVHLRETNAGAQILRETLTGIDGGRHPALAARVRWSFGNTLIRGDSLEPGLGHALHAVWLFARAGEWENEGAALSVVAHAQFTLGEPNSAYRAVHQSLHRLRPYRRSIRLHTVLTSVARILESDGLFEPAVALQNESVNASTRSGSAAHVVEARAARARLRARQGDAGGAREDVDAALALVGSVRDTVVRQWLRGDLYEVDALATLAGDPEHASAAFDSAAAYFTGIRSRGLPYLVGSAEAMLAAGDVTGAMDRLEAAIRQLDERRSSIRMEPRRAAVYDAARAVVDRVVMLKLRLGRAADALDYMDRARASLASAGASGADGEKGVSAPPGEVLVEYALVGDTLLAWTVHQSDVQVFQNVIDTVSLVRTIESIEAGLQSQEAEAAVRPLLAALYDSLLRPLEPRLGRSGTPVVIVADGALASVPFAALYDTRRARYVVQDRPTRFAVSLREARRRRGIEGVPTALLVVDPAFDPREHPLLERLRHAEEEVRAFADRYPGAAVLKGQRASAPALRAALERSKMVHFAGHAVFDDERPEQSYLVLAGQPNAPGKITAEELSRLDLRHVRLVVLAACRTVRSSQSRAGGFTGLSGALLAAGAGGAVGSTWDVDDRFTSVLIAEFHRRYQRSRDGPGALREAQLALLLSDQAVLRTPAAWAGFRYVGR